MDVTPSGPYNNDLAPPNSTHDSMLYREDPSSYKPQDEYPQEYPHPYGSRQQVTQNPTDSAPHSTRSGHPSIRNAFPGSRTEFHNEQSDIRTKNSRTGLDSGARTPRSQQGETDRKKTEGPVREADPREPSERDETELFQDLKQLVQTLPPQSRTSTSNRKSDPYSSRGDERKTPRPCQTRQQESISPGRTDSEFHGYYEKFCVAFLKKKEDDLSKKRKQKAEEEMAGLRDRPMLVSKPQRKQYIPLLERTPTLDARRERKLAELKKEKEAKLQKELDELTFAPKINEKSKLLASPGRQRAAMKYYDQTQSSIEDTSPQKSSRNNQSISTSNKDASRSRDAVAATDRLHKDGGLNSARKADKAQRQQQSIEFSPKLNKKTHQIAKGIEERAQDEEDLGYVETLESQYDTTAAPNTAASNGDLLEILKQFNHMLRDKNEGPINLNQLSKLMINYAKRRQAEHQHPQNPQHPRTIDPEDPNYVLEDFDEEIVSDRQPSRGNETWESEPRHHPEARRPQQHAPEAAGSGRKAPQKEEEEVEEVDEDEESLANIERNLKRIQENLQGLKGMREQEEKERARARDNREREKKVVVEEKKASRSGSPDPRKGGDLKTQLIENPRSGQKSSNKAPVTKLREDLIQKRLEQYEEMVKQSASPGKSPGKGAKTERKQSPKQKSTRTLTPNSKAPAKPGKKAAKSPKKSKASNNEKQAKLEQATQTSRKSKVSQPEPPMSYREATGSHREATNSHGEAPMSYREVPRSQGEVPRSQGEVPGSRNGLEGWSSTQPHEHEIVVDVNEVIRRQHRQNEKAKGHANHPPTEHQYTTEEAVRRQNAEETAVFQQAEAEEAVRRETEEEEAVRRQEAVSEKGRGHAGTPVLLEQQQQGEERLGTNRSHERGFVEEEVSRDNMSFSVQQKSEVVTPREDKRILEELEYQRRAARRAAQKNEFVTMESIQIEPPSSVMRNSYTFSFDRNDETVKSASAKGLKTVAEKVVRKFKKYDDEIKKCNQEYRVSLSPSRSASQSPEGDREDSRAQPHFETEKKETPKQASHESEVSTQKKKPFGKVNLGKAGQSGQPAGHGVTSPNDQGHHHVKSPHGQHGHWK